MLSYLSMDATPQELINFPSDNFYLSVCQASTRSGHLPNCFRIWSCDHDDATTGCTDDELQRKEISAKSTSTPNLVLWDFHWKLTRLRNTYNSDFNRFAVDQRTTELEIVRKSLPHKFFHWSTLFLVTFDFPFFRVRRTFSRPKNFTIYGLLENFDTSLFDPNGKERRDHTEFVLPLELEEFIFL